MSTSPSHFSSRLKQRPSSDIETVWPTTGIWNEFVTFLRTSQCLRLMLYIYHNMYKLRLVVECTINGRTDEQCLVYGVIRVKRQWWKLTTCFIFYLVFVSALRTCRTRFECLEFCASGISSGSTDQKVHRRSQGVHWVKKSKEVYSSLQASLLSPLRELKCHNYGIIQCYLPPDGGDISAFTPAEAGTRFSDPGGMQRWVEPSGWLEMVYSRNGHPSRTNRARWWLTSLMRPTTLTTTPSRPGAEKIGRHFYTRKL